MPKQQLNYYFSNGFECFYRAFSIHKHLFDFIFVFLFLSVSIHFIFHLIHVFFLHRLQYLFTCFLYDLYQKVMVKFWESKVKLNDKEPVSSIMDCSTKLNQIQISIIKSQMIETNFVTLRGWIVVSKVRNHSFL